MPQPPQSPSYFVALPYGMCLSLCHATQHRLRSSEDWGGGLRSAIYRNLPQFYRNFSVMPLFKNFNFPLRKNLSLPLMSLGTLYVSVFSSVLHVICVAGRFSVFVFPKCRLLLGTVILAKAKGQ